MDAFGFYPITVTVDVSPEQRQAVIRNVIDRRIEKLIADAWDVCISDTGELQIEGIADEFAVLADRHIAWRAVEEELISRNIKHQQQKNLTLDCYGDESMCGMSVSFRVPTYQDAIFFKLATQFQVLRITEVPND